MASRSTFALIRLGGVSAASTLPVDQGTPFVLDIPSIMRGPETVGREPSGIPDAKWIHFSWLSIGSAGRRD